MARSMKVEAQLRDTNSRGESSSYPYAWRSVRLYPMSYFRRDESQGEDSQKIIREVSKFHFQFVQLFDIQTGLSSCSCRIVIAAYSHLVFAGHWRCNWRRVSLPSFILIVSSDRQGNRKNTGKKLGKSTILGLMQHRGR